MTLAEWLFDAVKSGAEHIRLVPGRPALAVREGAESELTDAPLSSQSIEELIDPLLSSDARMDLALGAAHWEADVNGVGLVPASAEIRGGETFAEFALTDAALPRPPTASVVDSMPAVLAAPASSGWAARVRPPPAPSTSRAPAASSRAVPRAVAAASPPAAPEPAGSAPGAPAGEVTVLELEATSVVPAAPSGPAATVSMSEPPVQAARGNSIDRLLAATLEMRGSDLHLCSGVQPIVRVDGEMRVVPSTRALSSQELQRVLWPIVPERQRQRFAGKKDADFAYDLPGRARFRGNLFVDRRGLGAVFRVIPYRIQPIEQLGLPAEVIRLCQLPKGLVLVTGPTGSGKSTTLASLIDHINRTQNKHIITVEDPIEFVFENKKCLINQRQVGEHTESFGDALRAALREDPDIVLVGELRDLETIETALQTAETGHLVFGTLHTSSAPATVDRIIDQFPADRQNQIRIMLAESLKAVIAQMLCRRTNGGRVAAFEVLFGIPAVANLIRERKVYQLSSIMQTGRKIGMRTLNDSLIELVKSGTIKPEEALAKTNDRAALSSSMGAGQKDP